jgi:hypothetical protein
MSSAEHLEAGRAGAGAADGHVACSMTSTRLHRLRHTHGQAALDSILELAGGVRSPDELEASAHDNLRSCSVIAPSTRRWPRRSTMRAVTR